MLPFGEKSGRRPPFNAIFIAVWVISAYTLRGINAPGSFGGPCQTRFILKGFCTTLRFCPGLVARSSRTPIEDAAFRVESGCGFLDNQPMICCPQDSEGTISNLSDGEDDGAAAKTINSLIPTLQDCGEGPDSRKNISNIDDHPWLALLEYTTPSGKAFGCGGVLVSSRYVLTAAHCIQSPTISLNRSLTSIRLGEWNTASAKDCQQNVCADPPMDIPVESTTIHELYQFIMCGMQNDLGLVRMVRPVTYSDWVKPICVPLISQIVSQKSYIDEKLEIAGWGTSHAGPIHETKMKDYVLVVPETRCSSNYKKLNETLAGTRICGVNRHGDVSFRRDSGGPLMYRQEGLQSKWFVAGVSSFGPFHCAMNTPTVYTDVARYSRWILENIKP